MFEKVESIQETLTGFFFTFLIIANFFYLTVLYRNEDSAFKKMNLRG